MDKIPVTPFSAAIHETREFQLGDKFPDLLRHEITNPCFATSRGSAKRCLPSQSQVPVPEGMLFRRRLPRTRDTHDTSILRSGNNVSRGESGILRGDEGTLGPAQHAAVDQRRAGLRLLDLEPSIGQPFTVLGGAVGSAHCQGE